MISKIKRGRDVGGLIAYLFGPGRHNEHTDPHVVAHWSGLPGETVPTTADGGADLGPLTADLKTDLRAAGLLGAADTVWHCSVAIPAGDGPLSDAQWREVAEAVAEAVGLEDDQAGAVRWVAVRHGLSTAGNDHIHIAAALAGRTRHGDTVDRTFLAADYAKVRAVCNGFERAWRLTATGAGTGAGHRDPTRAETEIAARRGLRTEQRARLERAVRSAAVRAGGPQEFAALLAAEGVTATFSRESERRPGTYLAVTFHSDDYTDAAGAPVAFAGRSLGRDLSAPALQQRWDARAGAVPSGSEGRAVAGLVDALAAAAAAAGGSAGQLAAIRGQVAAGADALWAAAEAVEDDRGGTWHAAAREAARAAREPGGADRAAASAITGLLDGFSALPRGRTRAESELARAWSMYVRLLRMWARADRGESARVAATAASQIEAITGAAALRRTAPAAPTAATGPAAHSRGRGRGPEETTSSARSGA